MVQSLEMEDLIEKPWEVYIIETECNKLYTGIAKDAEKRFEEHMNSPRGAKFFRTARPKRIVYRERHKNRSEASIREAQIKKMSREKKLELIFE